MERCDFWTEPIVIGGVTLPAVQCTKALGHEGDHSVTDQPLPSLALSDLDPWELMKSVVLEPAPRSLSDLLTRTPSDYELYLAERYCR